MAQESPSIDYVYDFIYLDTHRLISYLAQLDENGVLLSIKKSGSFNEEFKSLNSLGLNTSTKISQENNESINKNVERHFDSNATAIYSVIDKLDELGFIGKDIQQTALGQMLLLSGSLAFRDIRMILKLWDPLMKLVISNSSNSKSKSSPQTKQLNNIKELLAALPHTLLMTIESNEHSIWSSLEESNLKISADDITLKHGSSFSGNWHVIGILDAKPDYASDNKNIRFNNEVFDSLQDVLNSVRTFIGRPSNAFGITPIAIFRTVNKYQ